MLNKTFFFILLIINNNLITLSKRCPAVVIKPNEYKFSEFKGEIHFIQDTINGEKYISAFDYIYLLDNQFQNEIYSQLYKNLGELNELEQKKINPDLFNYIYNYFFEGNGKEIQLDTENKNIDNIHSGELIEKLKEYNRIKENQESGTSIATQSCTYTLIGGGVGTASKFLLKGLELANPHISLLILGGTIGISLISRLYNNWFYEGNIAQKKNAIYKLTQIAKNINLYIYEGKWVDNNCILTAMDMDDDCLGNQAKFYYSPKVLYKNSHEEDNTEDIMEDMMNITCTYRKNDCDYDFCMANLKKYSECPSKRRKGELKKCPKFARNCSLTEF